MAVLLHARQLLPVALFAIAAPALAQATDSSLRLYGIGNSRNVRLVDTNGTVVHLWRTQVFPGLGVDMDDDGCLIRSVRDPGTGPLSGLGGVGGGVQRLAYDSTLLWDFRYNTTGLSHHDLEPLPNGNVLLIAWETKTRAEALAAGRNPLLVEAMLAVDHVVEVQPTGPTTGAIVWEWHVWDHLVQDHDPSKANYGVVADHAELLDVNFPLSLGNGDFNHVNAIDYDPVHDWIVLSAYGQSEVWIIDHSTTTAEAAGHTGGRWGKGGDLLYRWGNHPAGQRQHPPEPRPVVQRERRLRQRGADLLPDVRNTDGSRLGLGIVRPAARLARRLPAELCLRRVRPGGAIPPSGEQPGSRQRVLSRAGGLAFRVDDASPRAQLISMLGGRQSTRPCPAADAGSLSRPTASGR